MSLFILKTLEMEFQKGKEDEIFMPFFTTTMPPGPKENESTEILGTGLGLFIVKNIITSRHGTIEVIEASQSFRTCFKIKLPKVRE